nr:TetR/AcrR family transcriptional regulator [uncultured Noviherbaspirillum sp.]
MNSKPETSAARGTYRHGDLRRSLLDAGIEMARHGGPGAVVLREATRQAGVVPNAAYRHFASQQALLDAVRDHALAASAAMMEEELARVEPDLSAADAARASLRAVGRAYLRFAHAEPGLFRTAFAVQGSAGAAVGAGVTPNPFRLLGAALDRFVTAGILPPARRPGAEYLAWSAVHGLALLVTDGPLHDMPAVEREAIGERLLDMVEQGL